jgi:hypothetical protein
VLTHSGERAGGHGRRSPAAAVAGAVAPANRWSGLDNKQVWKLLRVLGMVVVALVGNGKDRKMELAVWVSHGAAAAARPWRSAHGKRLVGF